MKGKFLGFCLIVASTVILSLSSMQTESDAGLLGNRGGLLGLGLFSGCGGGGGGLQSYSSCGGGLQMYSSCGGGGLQMYSSCGGGGGGLQFAPQAYYAPPVQHVHYAAPAASNCPGGICPPSSDGFSFYSRPVQYARYVAPVPSIPAGVRLNPGESYVAGSWRSMPVRAVANRTTVPSRTEPFPDDSYLAQVSQRNCEPCRKDQELAKKEGVELVILYLDDPEDAVKIANLWPDNDDELTGTPAYIGVVNGKGVKVRTTPIDSADDLVAMESTVRRLSNFNVASTPKPKQTPLPEKKQVAKTPTSEERLERLEKEVSSIQQSLAAIQKSLETQRTASLD